MVNFYIAVVTIGMSMSIAQADYTYTINGRMAQIQLPVEEVPCTIGGPKCWFLRWPYLNTNEYKMAAKVLLYDENNDILYMNLNDSVINLCGSYQNGTWEEALKTLLVQALFPTDSKKCNFNGKNRYLIFEELQPVTITMNEKLNCTEYTIDAEVSVNDHEIYKLNDFFPDGSVIITFTIPDGDNCTRLQ